MSIYSVVEIEVTTLESDFSKLRENRVMLLERRDLWVDVLSTFFS